MIQTSRVNAGSLHFRNLSRVMHHARPILPLREALLVDRYRPLLPGRRRTLPDNETLSALRTNGAIPIFSKRTHELSAIVSDILDLYFASIQAYQLLRRSPPENFQDSILTPLHSDDPYKLKIIKAVFRGRVHKLLDELSVNSVVGAAKQLYDFLSATGIFPCIMDGRFRALGPGNVAREQFEDPVFHARLIYYNELFQDLTHALMQEPSAHNLVRLLGLNQELRLLLNIENYGRTLYAFGEQQRLLRDLSISDSISWLIALLNSQGYFIHRGSAGSKDLFIVSRGGESFYAAGKFSNERFSIELPLDCILYAYPKPTLPPEGLISDLEAIALRLILNSRIIRNREVCGHAKTQLIDQDTEPVSLRVHSDGNGGAAILDLKSPDHTFQLIEREGRHSLLVLG